MIRKEKENLLLGNEEGVYIDTKKSELYIYGAIGIGDGTYVNDVEAGISMITGKEVYLHISSPGGDAFEGIAIYNFLKQSGKTITVICEGLVASAASIIAMAGDKIEMEDDARLMIHNAASYGFGNAEFMEKRAAALHSANQAIKASYMGRFNGSENELTSFMAKETYFTATEAIEWGFADSIRQNNTGGWGSVFENSSLRTANKKKAQARMLSRFKNYIDNLTNNLGGK